MICKMRPAVWMLINETFDMRYQAKLNKKNTSTM